MADDNTKDTQNPKGSDEIEPLTDESLEDVAGGWCSIIACSGQKPAAPAPTP